MKRIATVRPQGSFLFRLRCACAVLDSGQSQEQAAVAAYSKHLSRWIEYALRDAAVLLAGLPLQSVKSYQPACFNFADYKTVQPYFRDAVPSLLRGVCAMCTDMSLPAKRSSPTAFGPKSWVLSQELASLSLGVVVTLLPDATIEDLQVFVDTVRQVILASQTEEHAAVSLSTFMDLLGCLWKDIFCRAARCEALLMSLMELMHGVSEVLFRKTAVHKSGAVDTPWLEGLCSDDPEGQSSRSMLGGYALHVVAATMRKSDVSEKHLAMTLEVFQWWLQEALPNSPDTTEDLEDDLMAQALAEETEEDLVVGETCPWLWLLLSPFPESLVQSHPSLTLKHWKQVCCMLSTTPSGGGSSQASRQLLYLALISNKLCASVIDKMDSAHLPEAERVLVYAFAMLVPAISAMAMLSKASREEQAGEEVQSLDSEQSLVQKCLERMQGLFELAWQHPNPKVAQVAISSAQSLLQQPACSDLCSVIVPGLVAAIAMEPPKMQPLAMEQAWGIFPTLLQVQEAKIVTLQLVLQLVCALASAKLESVQKTSMARCLMQVAQIDQGGLKNEVQRLPAESQRTVQELLRAHVTAGRTEATGSIPRGTPLAQKKIELKLKF